MIRAALSALLVVSATLAGARARAQDPAAPASQEQSPSPADAHPAAKSSTKPKPKKVWTNENLDDAGGTISVVGSAKKPTPAESAPAKSSASTVDPRVVRALREQLHRLEAQLAVIDQQIADMKDFGKGESRGTAGLSTNTFQYSTASVEDRIKQLQDKKSGIQGKIDAILDAARRNGIEPGELR
jgi:hypothetical protein